MLSIWVLRKGMVRGHDMHLFMMLPGEIKIPEFEKLVVFGYGRQGEL